MGGFEVIAPLITIDSQHPVVRGDKAFFAAHPVRRFRARPFAECDSPLPPWVTLFSDDGAGVLAECNLVIVARLKNGRKRMIFATSDHPVLDGDRAIELFLRSRNIDPVLFEPFAR